MTLSPRLSPGVSKSMLEKIAGSGLTYQNLQVAFRRGGAEGLRLVLTEQTESGKARVTTNRRVLDYICSHFESVEE